MNLLPTKTLLTPSKQNVVDDSAGVVEDRDKDEGVQVQGLDKDPGVSGGKAVLIEEYQCPALP